jgi:hypothetical protein
MMWPLGEQSTRRGAGGGCGLDTVTVLRPWRWMLNALVRRASVKYSIGRKTELLKVVGCRNCGSTPKWMLPAF